MSRPIDIYTRISAMGDRQEDHDLQSPETQAEAARRHIESLGLPVGRVFHDTQSGTKTVTRRGLVAALERLERGESGGICAAYRDRLARSNRAWTWLVERVAATDGKLFAPDLGEHESANGALILEMQLMISNYLLATTRERVHAARTRAIMREKKTVGSAIPGYHRVDKRLVIDAEAAPHVRQAFQMRLSGMGHTQIAEWLNERGVRTRPTKLAPTGNPMTYASVQLMLRNRAYLGETRSRGKKSGDIVNPAAHTPLIDRETFDAVQAVEEGKRGRARPRRQDYYSLSGLLVCDSCGHLMQGSRTTAGKRMYRCTGRAVGGCSNRARIYAGLVETEVEDLFLGLVNDVEYRKRAAGPDAIRIRALTEELAVAERRLEQALSPESQDALGDVWAETVRLRREARDTASAELGRERAISPIEEEMLNLREQWAADQISDDDKRRLLGHYFPRITVRRTDEKHPGTGYRVREVTITPGYSFKA